MVESDGQARAVSLEAAERAAAQRDAAQRELWARTAAVAGRLNRAHGELVAIVVELVEGKHWGDGGFRSPEHYLVVRAGLSPAHARDVMALARRRVELPAASEALTAGRLSLDQVAVVAHHVPASYQQSVTDLARHATVPQLRRAVSRHAFAVPEPPQDVEARGADPGMAERSESERRACARPELSMQYDRDGRFQLRYSAPATVGALVEQALKEAKDALFLGRTQTPQASRSGQREASGAREQPSHAEALEELAFRSFGTVAGSRRAHYRVDVHLSTDGVWIGGGHAIPQALVQRFLSDGVLQPVWETEGRPVSVGRTMRIVPPRSRRLIEDRDRGCRFPGCTGSRFVEIHHLREWSQGGATDLDNLVSLCPFHHDAVSRGDYVLTGDPTRPDGLDVTSRSGRRIGPPPWRDLAPPPGGDPALPAGQTEYEPPTGESARWSEIEVPPDAALARSG